MVGKSFASVLGGTRKRWSGGNLESLMRVAKSPDDLYMHTQVYMHAWKVEEVEIELDNDKLLGDDGNNKNDDVPFPELVITKSSKKSWAAKSQDVVTNDGKDLTKDQTLRNLSDHELRNIMTRTKLFPAIRVNERCKESRQSTHTKVYMHARKVEEIDSRRLH